MEKYYKLVLEKLESNGYVAYVVGGFVRDQLLNISSMDIDITTNATPKDLNKIFENNLKTYEEYGAVKLTIDDHIIDVTTFRKESSYSNNKPTSIEYTNSLESDLKRRDFTINTLVMDIDGNIIDLLNGLDDLSNRIIKTVKPVEISFEEDKTRMLRAIRFMSLYDFSLDNEILDYIQNHKEYFKQISLNKKLEELNKVFKSPNSIKFLKFIKENNLEEYLGIKSNNVVYTSTVIGIYSQLDILEEFPFTKLEKEQIKQIKKIINKKIITPIEVYKYGLFISQIAGEILGIEKKKINLMYTNLPIKSIIEINFSAEDISKFLNVKGKELGEILDIVEKNIIEGKLQNKEESIKEFLTARQ